MQWFLEWLLSPFIADPTCGQEGYSPSEAFQDLTYPVSLSF